MHKMSESEIKPASPIPTVMCAQCCSSSGGSGKKGEEGGGGGRGGGGGSGSSSDNLMTTQCSLQVTSRMLRSPSHESVTTDLSLFSVSSIASDLRGANRLVTFKSYSDAQLAARGPSPKPDSRQIQGNRFVLRLHVILHYTFIIVHKEIIPYFYSTMRTLIDQRTFLKFFGSKKKMS